MAVVKIEWCGHVCKMSGARPDPQMVLNQWQLF